MDLTAIAFGALSVVLLGAALAVITARNPVHSVLFLILSFFSGAGLFVLLGAEFLAMLLVVVYVGAVAVLFLFVVMMLDVDFALLRTGFVQYVPIGLLVSGLLLVEMVLISGAVAARGAAAGASVVAAGSVSNIEALGRVLGLEDRLLFSENAVPYFFLWRLVDPLVEALEVRRVAVHERAHRIAYGVVPRDAGDALTLLMAVGPGAETLRGGTPGETCGQIKRALEHRIEFFVLRLLRRWTKDGYLQDVAAA